MIERSERIRAAIEMTGLISVVASLVFVGLELQQSSAVARVQAQQTSSQIINDAFAVVAEDPELATLVTNVNTGRTPVGELSLEQTSRLFIVNLMFLQAGQTAFLAAEAGIINEEYIAAMSGSGMINPFMRAYWDNFRLNLDPSYAAHLESIVDLRR